MSRVPVHKVMSLTDPTLEQKQQGVRTYLSYFSKKDDGDDVFGYCERMMFASNIFQFCKSKAERQRMCNKMINAVTPDYADSLWGELDVRWYFESKHNPHATRLQQGRAFFRLLLDSSVSFSLPLLGGTTDNPLAGIEQPITVHRPPNQADQLNAKYEFLNAKNKQFYCYGKCQLQIDKSGQWVIGPTVATLDTFSHVRFNGVCPLKQRELLAEHFPTDVGLIILRMALEAEVAPAKVRAAKRQRRVY